MSTSDASEASRLREELAAAVRDGTETVMRRFYDQHFPAVHRYVLCRMNGDHAETEEIVSDVFFQAFRDIEQYDGSSPPGAWLQGIARHRVVDVLRKKGRRPETPLGDGESPDRLLDLEAGELPDAALERAELAQRVALALSELPAEYEQVLRRHYLEDQPVKDLAEALQITPKAAEARLFRARQAFRDAFRSTARELNGVGKEAGHE
jgi:RNA polymerase sigma-70 factor (ECF subfamily)